MTTIIIKLNNQSSSSRLESHICKSQTHK